MDAEETLLNIFEQKGIYLSKQELDDNLEMDSIQFITIIVEIENEFSISIEDEDLLFEKFKTFNDYLKVVQSFQSLGS